MQNNQIFYICIMLLSVFLSAVSQVLLKKAAQQPHSSLISEYLNFRVILAYALFLGCTFLTMYAYKAVPLSLGPVIESTSYIYIAIFGIVFFKEKMNRKKWIALLLIVSGVILIALP